MCRATWPKAEHKIWQQKSLPVMLFPAPPPARFQPPCPPGKHATPGTGKITTHWPCVATSRCSTQVWNQCSLSFPITCAGCLMACLQRQHSQYTCITGSRGLTIEPSDSGGPSSVFTLCVQPHAAPETNKVQTMVSAQHLSSPCFF